MTHEAVINEMMVHLEDLTGEKLDWAIDSKWQNHAVISFDSLEIISECIEYYLAAS